MRLARLAAALCAGATLSAQAQQAPPSAPASAMLQQAAEAEASGQLAVALDRLYSVQLERPRSPDALTARVSLARLLTLEGDLPSAILQAQALYDDAPPDGALRASSINLTTLLARRLRTKVPSTMYQAPEAMVARGLTNLDEPTALLWEPGGALVVMDQGNNRIFRIVGDATTTLNVGQEPTAAGLLGTSLVVGAKAGLSASPPGAVMPTSGTWDGKARPVRKVRSVAANSKGDLFVVDRDYDGLLKCQAGATSCAPWGPPGKLRVVKVGPSDLVVTVVDKQNVVRVIDTTGKLLTTVGPTVGGVKLDNVVDVDVDRAYSLYVLDNNLRRIDVAALRLGGDGRMTAEPFGLITIPPEGARGMKNPSALAVAPDGTVVVAGRGTSQLLRFR